MSGLASHTQVGSVSDKPAATHGDAYRHLPHIASKKRERKSAKPNAFAPWLPTIWCAVANLRLYLFKNRGELHDRLAVAHTVYHLYTKRKCSPAYTLSRCSPTEIGLVVTHYWFIFNGLRHSFDAFEDNGWKRRFEWVTRQTTSDPRWPGR